MNRLVCVHAVKNEGPREEKIGEFAVIGECITKEMTTLVLSTMKITVVAPPERKMVSVFISLR